MSVCVQDGHNILYWIISHSHSLDHRTHGYERNAVLQLHRDCELVLGSLRACSSKLSPMCLRGYRVARTQEQGRSGRKHRLLTQTWFVSRSTVYIYLSKLILMSRRKETQSWYWARRKKPYALLMCIILFGKLLEEKTSSIPLILSEKLRLDVATGLFSFNQNQHWNKCQCLSTWLYQATLFPYIYITTACWLCLFFLLLWIQP